MMLRRRINQSEVQLLDEPGKEINCNPIRLIVVWPPIRLNKGDPDTSLRNTSEAAYLFRYQALLDFAITSSLMVFLVVSLNSEEAAAYSGTSRV